MLAEVKKWNILREREREGVKKAREGVKKWEYFEREREREETISVYLLSVAMMPT